MSEAPCFPDQTQKTSRILFEVGLWNIIHTEPQARAEPREKSPSSCEVLNTQKSCEDILRRAEQRAFGPRYPPFDRHRRMAAAPAACGWPGTLVGDSVEIPLGALKMACTRPLIMWSTPRAYWQVIDIADVIHEHALGRHGHGNAAVALGGRIRL